MDNTPTSGSSSSGATNQYIYVTPWTSTRNGVTKKVLFQCDRNHNNVLMAYFWIYATWPSGTNHGAVDNDCAYNEATRSGTITMADLSINKNNFVIVDSITLPTDIFAQGKMFTFVYASDMSSVTLTSAEDNTKTWTFTRAAGNPFI